MNLKVQTSKQRCELSKMAAGRSGEYGWNDPPPASYQDGIKNPNKKTGPFNKTSSRPVHPGAYTTAGIGPPPLSSDNPHRLVVGNVKLQSSSTASSQLPPPSLSTPPTTSSPSPSVPPTDSHQSANTDTSSTDNVVLLDKQAILECFTGLLEKKRPYLSATHSAEINKRLGILTKQWDNGKISDTVHRKLSQLVNTIKKDDKSRVESLLVELMVNHVTEVNQWMIGIKKLVNTRETST